MRPAISFAPGGVRNQADLRDSTSFDHVGRDESVNFAAGRVLADLADTDPRIVVGCADLSYVTRLSEFGVRHPDRFLYYGISERNMLSAAAGLATTGLLPYVCTFACFSAVLGYENIRTDLAYPCQPVRVLATHAGISMGFFGTSHHATEDLSALRAVAGLMIVSAADPISTEALLKATVNHDGPIYFRIGRGRDPAVYDDVSQLVPDRPTELAVGTDVLLVTTGAMVQACLDAVRELAQKGVSASVVDVHTIKPFPALSLAELASRHDAVVTVEEHSIEGGLGTMTLEAMAAQGVTTPVHKHGLRDEYALVGPPSHLYRYYGLDGHGVATVATRLLNRSAGPMLVAEPLWTVDDRQAVYAEYGVER